SGFVNRWSGVQSSPSAPIHCPSKRRRPSRRNQIEPSRVLTFMRVREEYRDMVLLAAVALVCALIALTAAAFDLAPSTAGIPNQQAALTDGAPVRIVGVPFV